MDRKQVDIVQLVERRRKCPVHAKARIMEEALAPDTTIASVADRHGVARSQVYGRLKKARAGKLPGISLSARQPVPPSCRSRWKNPQPLHRCLPLAQRPPRAASPVLSRSPLAMAAP